MPNIPMVKICATVMKIESKLKLVSQDPGLNEKVNHDPLS